MKLVCALAGAVSLIGLTLPACAAAAQESRSIKVAEAAHVEGSASPVTDADGEAYACNRVRRRLWVEGEGWMVRRVTTCR